MRWVVKAFALPRGGTVLDEWQDSAPPRAAAKLDQRLNFMKDRPTTQWPYDYAHPLTGGEGVWEIKFEWGNIAYRPLFFLGPYPEELTLLFMAEERGGRWKPSGAMGGAIVRMNDVSADKRKAVICDDY